MPKMIKLEVIRKGRRQLGAFYEIEGHMAYISFKRTANIYMNGKGTISDALRAGVAMWGFDQDLVYKAERKGAKLIGIWDKTENELHLTQISRALDPMQYSRASHAGYSLQRMLPVSIFKKIRLSVKLTKG